MTTRLQPGDTAPDFTLPDDTGAEVTLSDLRGQKVIVYFYPAAMTPGCTKQACDFSDSIDRLQAEGYTVLGIKVSLNDGKAHDVDSSEMAFKIAAQAWFREAIGRAGPVLLEPVMAVEVVTPEDYMGDVVGDLNSRRGRVGQVEARGNNQVVTAQVPLSEMFGYATDLRSRTQGRATYTMQFDSYQQTPASVQEEIVKRFRGE